MEQHRWCNGQHAEQHRWCNGQHTEQHRWCNCQHADLKCGRSWVGVPLRSKTTIIQNVGICCFRRLSTPHFQKQDQICWFRIFIMCPSRASCLYVNRQSVSKWYNIKLMVFVQCSLIFSDITEVVRSEIPDETENELQRFIQQPDELKFHAVHRNNLFNEGVSIITSLIFIDVLERITTRTRFNNIFSNTY